MKFGVFALLFLLVIPSALGATLYGTVYDLSLNKADDVSVEVQGDIKQRDITANGEFTFELLPGNYTVKADQFKNGFVVAQAEEVFQIKSEGQFRMDLILFPVLEEPVSFIPESELDLETGLFEEPEDPYFFVYRIIAVIALLFACYMFIMMKKNPTFLSRLIKKTYEPTKAEKEFKKVEEPLPASYTPLEEIIDFIKKQGGRTTQKEIRKAFPQSEAKISLMINELEAKGKIQKFKKGRGNIVSLK